MGIKSLHWVQPHWTGIKSHHWEKFEAHVRILKDRREKLLGLKEAEEGKSRECLERVESERQKVSSQFGALRRLLGARERLLLERLGQLRHEVARSGEDKVNRILGAVSAIDGRIRELQDKCRLPACEFLRVWRLLVTINHILRPGFNPSENKPQQGLGFNPSKDIDNSRPWF
ncbi:hypothetical protein Q9233_017852 [Columba guinea]|nr:hypothetical protein Q9233_017852 [Columba guinea]